MLLLIDAGNTRIKWALAAAGAALADWHASGAVDLEDLNRLPAAWSGQRIERAIIANVAGSKVRDQLQLMIPAARITWFAAQRQQAGMINAYRDPAQLGCDRFAAAIGARALAPGQALVVATCGTATTIDAVSADGVFRGGMILPGLGLMAAALARGTAQLPQVQFTPAARPGFADNTLEAIRSGCLAAQAGAIERACALHGAALCILSGGAAAAIAPALDLPGGLRLVDNIVLTGLHSVAMSLTPPQERPC